MAMNADMANQSLKPAEKGPVSLPHSYSNRQGVAVSGYGTGIGFLLGAALQNHQPVLWPAWAYASLFFSCLLIFGILLWARLPRWRHAQLPSFLIFCLAFVVTLAMSASLMFAWAGLRADAQASQRLDPAFEGQDLRVTGVIAAMPRLQDGTVRFRFDVESAETLVEQPARVPDLLDVSWFPQNQRFAEPVQTTKALGDVAPDLKVGQRWRMTLRLRAPHGSVNPNGFDYELWLWEQGVHATAYVRTTASVDLPVQLASPGFWRWQPDWAIERMRQAARDAMSRYFLQQPEGKPDAAISQNTWLQASAVVTALVTGDQRLIEQSAWEIYRVTGVAHLMAISGLHITMFAWLATRLVGWVWRASPRLMLCIPAITASLAGGVLLATAYAVFSGWGIPAQRTTLMLWCWVLLQLCGQRWPWHATLLLAAVVVTCWQPLALLQAGFWLSFVAVAVLLGMLGGNENKDDESLEPANQPATQAVKSLGSKVVAVCWSLICGVGRFFCDLAKLQWRISLALAPLTAILFGQISLVGLIANMLAIPVVTFVITPLAMLGGLVPWLWRVATYVMLWLDGVLAWLALWPVAMLNVPVAPLWQGAAGLVGALLLVSHAPWTWRLLGLPVFLLMFLWQPLLPAQGQFRLLAADVGQGSAVLVQTRAHTLLYDSGPRFMSGGDAGRSILVPLLRSIGAKPDVLVLSHGDSDHVGGAEAILQTFSPERVLAPFVFASSSDGVMSDFCHAGVSWQWDDVEFRFVHPLAASAQEFRQSPVAGLPGTNAISCVLQIRALDGTSALLTGDIGRIQELDLTLRESTLRSDFLLIPHHGSRHSSSQRFIQTVQPRVAVAQAGYRNAFGHPAPDVLHRLGEMDVRVFASPSCGAASWSSDKPDVVQCARETGRRFWHRN